MTKINKLTRYLLPGFFMLVVFASGALLISPSVPAQEALSPEGVLLSDDVDHSMAFFDFCMARSRKPILLLDTRKVFGLVLAGT